MGQRRIECPLCYGTGELGVFTRKCHRCDGTGTIEGKSPWSEETGIDSVTTPIYSTTLDTVWAENPWVLD